MLFVIILLPLLLGIACFFLKNAFSKAHTALLLTVQTVIVALLAMAAFSGGAWSTAAIALTDSLTFALKLVCFMPCTNSLMKAMSSTPTKCCSQKLQNS